MAPRMKKLLLIVLAAFIAGLIWGYVKESPEPQTSSTALCEVGHANPDGSITLNENHPGSYEYTVLATSQGIKVFTTCN